MDEQLKRNMSAGQTWTRLVFMIGFAIILYVTLALYAVFVVVQFLFVLFTGERNAKLIRFGDILCQYINHMLRFISYTSDEKPFPFSDLPESTVVVMPPVPEPEPEPKPTPRTEPPVEEPLREDEPPAPKV